MEKSKRERLEAAGWHVGAVEDLLDLTPAESALVDLKLSLSDALRRVRANARLTQAGLARRIGSSQSRVAKMESADPSVSLDLVIRALFGAGASRRVIAEAIAPPHHPAYGRAEVIYGAQNTTFTGRQNTASPAVTMTTAENMVNRAINLDSNPSPWEQTA